MTRLAVHRRLSGPLTLAALIALAGCDSDGTVPEMATSLAIQVEVDAEVAQAFDAGVIRIEGPTNRVVNVQPGETRTIEGLQPGAYTVALEGLVDSRLLAFGQTGVTVVAGQNRQANVTLQTFVPGFTTVPSEAVPGTPFTVRFDAVNGATAYRVEWDEDPGFPSPQSTEVTGTSASVTLPDAGDWYLRVAARNRFGTNGVHSTTRTVAVAEPIVSIADARALSGEVVTVEGVVTFQESWNQQRVYFFQDGTAGISTFHDGAPTLPRGSRIRVTGTVGAFQGEVQLSPVTDLEILGQGAVPDPRPVTGAQIAGGQFQGELVRVTGSVVAVEVTDGFDNHTVTVRDGAGTDFLVRVDNRVGVASADWPAPGGGVEVTGVLGTDDTNTGRRIEVRGPEDLVLTGGDASLSVGTSPSTTLQAGQQLGLPLVLDLQAAGGLEVGELVVELRFSAVLFGSASWVVDGQAFDVEVQDRRVENGIRIAQVALTRDVDPGASGTAALLTVDPAEPGTGSVEARILSAATPTGDPIPAGTFATVPHTVTIEPANPTITTLQPGQSAGNVSGGVHYFRVPLAAPAAAPGDGPHAVGPVFLPRGEPRSGFGLGDAGRAGSSPFEAVAAERVAEAVGGHVSFLDHLRADGPGRPAPEVAAQAVGPTLRLRIREGTGDADLYVRLGALPTPNTFDCRPFVDGNSETCDIIDPPAGEYFVMIRPFGVTRAYEGLVFETFLYDPVAIVTASLADAARDVPYTVELEATGGDGTYAWSVVGGTLPPGIELAPDGTLSGTPTTEGDYTFTLEVASASQTAQLQYTLGVLYGQPMAYVYARFPQEPSYIPSDSDFRDLALGDVLITRLATGTYQLDMGFGDRVGDAFSAYVNAVSPAPNDQLGAGGPVCRLREFVGSAGVPLRALVVCEDAVTGAAVDAQFRLLVLGNDVVGGPRVGGAQAAFSFHSQEGATTAYTPLADRAWNSRGAAQTVGPQPNGLIRHVTGLDVGVPFTVAASAVGGGVPGAGGDVCRIQTGASAIIDIHCATRGGADVDRSHFALQLETGRADAPWAYTYVAAGEVQPEFTAASAGGVSGVQSGVGRWTLTFDGIELTQTPAIMVTPLGQSGDAWAHCSHFRTSSAPLVVDVACYGATGAFVDRAFLAVVLR